MLRPSALLVLLLVCIPCFADAPASRPSRAAQRAAALKSTLDSFSLSIEWNGIEDRPMPRLRLHVVAVDGKDPYGVQIDAKQAERIVDYLAGEGFLDQSLLSKDMRIPAGYMITVSNGDPEAFAWFVAIGDPENLLPRLAGLRTVLEDEAAKAVTAMLHRLGYQEPASQPASRPSEKAQKRATDLKANIEQFSLRLSYHGDQDKPFYNLSLTMTAPPVDDDVFFGRVQLTKEQAGKVVGFLLADGFLERAHDPRVAEEVERRLPCYSLTVGSLPSGEVLYENLGWAPQMFQRLDGLRMVLDGNAAKAMDLLLGRLNGFREKK